MKATAINLPSPANWRTTDLDEVNRRRQRARDESFLINNQDERHAVFSNFRVKSASGLSYSVEIRDVAGREFSCDCVDFRTNGLGTCKHVEAVLLQLEARLKRRFSRMANAGSGRIDIALDAARTAIRVARGLKSMPRELKALFDREGRLLCADGDEAVARLREVSADCPQLRVSQEIAPWLDERRRVAQGRQLRHEYELKVQRGEWPAHETKVALFPYQREGMLHLAFAERALLADEMGLGKTIQAIAACALLRRIGQAHRVLVVTPASLKTEWEEQIGRFTDLPYQLVFGGRRKRLAAYQEPPFFSIVNYEQMVGDALDVNQWLRPDIVVLDEAQRIKNWSTKTAQAIKRLRSRYAFVLTGTPIENRIDELHSLMDFLNPAVLGPLFRFNREFYELDDRGRPIGIQNLDKLHERVRPFMLRRRKSDVETELPERTDQNRFVPMSDAQRATYKDHEDRVARLANAARRRPLTKQEQEKLQRELAMMRMICDTNYILDPEDRTCPKLAELEKLLEECRANDAKVIVFSEWERMLELVRDFCGKEDIGFAWHTGSVPQKRRRAEINAFKNDPACRVFLSTDAGATGLNLQVASVVINCDLPWNPAKLEQRIARAWRKHQTRAVSVFNLVTEGSIEQRMLDTLATKTTVAESVLDHPGKVTRLKLSGGRQAFVERLEQILSAQSKQVPPAGPVARTLPADPALAFAQLARERINGALVTCEERYPDKGSHSVLVAVVDGEAARWLPGLQSIHADLFGPGKTDPLAPCQLEVIDRATHETIERLVAAGLLARATRASRPLWPESHLSQPVPLSAEDAAKASGHRDKAAHALRLAGVLREAGFRAEARGHALDAMLALARTLAVENRAQEPATLVDALRPPWSHLWGGRLGMVQALADDASGDCAPVLEAMAG